MGAVAQAVGSVAPVVASVREGAVGSAVGWGDAVAASVTHWVAVVRAPAGRAMDLADSVVRGVDVAVQSPRCIASEGARWAPRVEAASGKLADQCQRHVSQSRGAPSPGRSRCSHIAGGT